MTHVIAEQEAVAVDLVDGEMKNAKSVWCRLCGCHILAPKTAQLVRRRFELPVSRRRVAGARTGAGTAAAAAAPAPVVVVEGTPVVELMWHVSEMMEFQNIGFTRSVDVDVPANPDPAAPGAVVVAAAGAMVPAADASRKKRYLTCADCEKEVLGIQFLDEPKNFYLCADRVVYEKPHN